MTEQITFDLRVYADGKTTIPRTIRERLDLKAGDIISVRSGRIWRSKE